MQIRKRVTQVVVPSIVSADIGKARLDQIERMRIPAIFQEGVRKIFAIDSFFDPFLEDSVHYYGVITRSFRFIVLLTVLCSFFLLSTQVSLAKSPQVVDVEAPLCRFGVNVVSDMSSHDLTPLRLGWYMNYNAFIAPEHPNGIEYALMIRLEQIDSDTYGYSPNGDELQAAILNNLGADWFIGNEPDRRIFQDDMEPHLYARAYHDLYALIKEADPTAQLFAGNIVQPTPIRLQYLDLILASYEAQYGETMPVDGWAIHNFILNEVSCEYDAANCWGAAIPPGIDADTGMIVSLAQNDDFLLFAQQIVRFREWMVSKGYRNAPLYLSEYGVLMPNIFDPPADFPPERVNLFMNQTFDYVLNTTDPLLGNPNDGNRLIQRLSWYSTTDTEFNGYLFEREQSSDPYQLSPMGSNFAAYTANVSEVADLYPTTLTVVPSSPITQAETMTLTLTATVANSGHGLMTQRATVRFYDGDPSAGANQLGSEQQLLLSGCGDFQTTQITVEGMPRQTTRIYLSIDPENQIVESNESNNLLSKVILVDGNYSFFPYIPH